MEHNPTMDEIEDAARKLTEGLAILRAVLRDAEQDAPRLSRDDHRWAMRQMLDVRQMLLDATPAMLATVVDVARCDADDLPAGMSAEDMASCRSILVDNGLLTAGELASFPVASLRAIAVERFLTRHDH